MKFNKEWLEAIPDAAVALSANRQFVAFNDRFTEIFGSIPDKRTERPGPLIDLMASCFPERAEFDEKWRSLSGHGPASDEWRIASPELRSLQVTARPLPDGGRLFVWRDTSHPNRLQQALFRAEKLQAIGMLAGGIAHDFNNLLTAISGNLALLADHLAGGREPAQCLPLLEAASTAAQSGRDLVKKMMHHARASAGTPQPFELSGLVADVRTLLKASVSPLILIQVQLPKSLWPVLADRSSIQQVLLNLCVNAVDAVKERSDARIIITGTNHFQLGHREKPDAATADYVGIEVRDNGEGIPASVLSHIFEPFVTTKAPGEGTGLGLASSREIIRQQGGWLEYESEPGRGATLRFFLPRGTVPQDGKTAEASRAEANASRGTEKVLVVDDDPLVRNVSAKLLGVAGYKVETACDGIEALDRLRQPGPPVDVVLLDLAMPRLSGVDTMREIQRIMPGLRVVLCSGSLSLASPSAFKQKYGLHPDATLAKPYEVAELSRTVRRALDSSRLPCKNGTGC